MNYVVIATDDNPQYFDFVPICAASFQRLGFSPLVVCVNTTLEPRAAEATFLHVNETRIKPSRAAMIARFLVQNHLTLNDDDILMTTDADNIILQAPWKDEAVALAKDGHMVSISHDWTRFNIIAAWYVMGTVKTWREVFPWTLEELMTLHLEELQGELGFSFDERWLKRDVYTTDPERWKFIKRPLCDRINSQALDGICDIHCHIGPRVYEL